MSDPLDSYRTAPYLRFPLDSGRELLHFPLAGHNEVLSPTQVNALTAWTEFMTLEEQTTRSRSEFAFPSSDDLRSMLEGFRESGILLAYRDLISRAETNCIKEESGPLISWLAIPTNSRLHSAMRTVATFGANRQRFGRHYKLFLSNNTDDAALDLSYRDSLARLSKEAGLDSVVFYAGAVEKRAFAKRLASESTVPSRVIDLTLFGYPQALSTGANRNAILLQTIGSLLLSVDDDIIGQTSTALGSDGFKSLVLGAHRNPSELWCFKDRHTALGFGSPTDLDIVAGHETLLGRSIAEIVSGSLLRSDRMDVSEICSHLVTTLMTGDGIVRSTYNGALGDSGFHSVIGVVAHPSKRTRERVHILGANWRSVIGSREIATQSLASTISHGDAAGLGMCLGLDNRQMLPPFPPGYRNQDGVFAALLSRCCEHAYVGHLPFMLLHDPSEPRHYSADSGPRVSDVLLGALSTVHLEAWESTVTERVLHAGRHLTHIGRLSESAFREWLGVTLCSRASALIRVLDDLLVRDSYTPERWVEELEGQIGYIKLAIQGQTLPRFLDLPVMEPEDTLKSLRQIVYDYGEILMWWPELLAGTQKLAESGLLIGRALCS